MKKNLVIPVIILFFFSIFKTMSVCSITYNEIYTKECLKHLDECKIVETPEKKWENGDYIKRRDVFDIVNSIKDPDMSYDVAFSHREPEEIKEMAEYNFPGKFKFDDIEFGSKDYYLAYAFFANDLLKGSTDKEVTLARFDDDITYYEAITILGRMFTKRGYLHEATIIEKYASEFPFYDFLEDVRIINSKSPNDPYCPQISLEQLPKKITAYDFLTLLDRSLYVPSFSYGDYAPSIRRCFIDYFSIDNEQNIKIEDTTED